MKSAGLVIQQMKNMSHIDTEIKCRRCGQVIQLVGKQYTAVCSGCGLFIQVTPATLLSLKQSASKEKHNACALCEDTGIVVLEKQVDKAIAEYAYKCVCTAGQQRTELKAWPNLPPNILATMSGHAFF